MYIKIRERYENFISEKSNLDLFLIKAGGLAALYFIFRILFRKLLFLKAIFVFSKKAMIKFLVKSSYWLLHILGYDVHIYNKIVYIEGSEGVKVVNACIGWSLMALFAGFLIAYPGVKKTKYWYIPLGLAVICLANILRIALMAVISYKSVDSLDFYHRYIFNFILYVVVFGLWALWIGRFSKKKEKIGL